MNNKIPKIDVVVSRHKTFIEYIKEEGIVSEKTMAIGHAAADDVSGKHVLGAIPPHLAVLAASVTTVPIIVPPNRRGVELSVDEIRTYARKPETYIITKMDESYALDEIYTLDKSYTLDELIDQLQRLKDYACSGDERTGVMDVTINTGDELREVVIIMKGALE